MSAEPQNDRAAIVAETLAFLAGGWVTGTDNQAYLREVVERIQRDVPTADSWCCPLCEEVTCDSGCPLAPLRSQAPHQGRHSR